MSARLTACVLTFNEEAFIERCLRSLRPLADEVVVFDTGSQDRTIDISARLADRIEHIEFSGDFSATRNLALRHVDCDWVLFLDADECFDGNETEAVRPYLGTLPDEVDALRLLRYSFFPTGGWYSGRELRMFRGDRGLYYRGRLHEDVSESVGRRGGLIADIPVMFNHYGHCRSVAIRQAKADRYVRWTDEWLRSEPFDAEAHAYKALWLRMAGLAAPALEQSIRAVALAPDDARILGFHAHVLRATGDLRGARAMYQESWLGGGDPAWLHMAGVMSLMLGDLDSALTAFDDVLARDRLLVHVEVNRALAAEAQGRYEDAVRCYSVVAARNPGFLRRWPRRSLEQDIYSPLVFETVSSFAGVGPHLASCREILGRRSAGADGPLPGE